MAKRTKRVVWGLVVLLAVVMEQVAASEQPAARGASLHLPFPDVPPHHWAAEALAVSTDWAILNGYPDGRLNGKGALNRNEFAVGVQRFLQRLQFFGEGAMVQRQPLGVTGVGECQFVWWYPVLPDRELLWHCYTGWSTRQ